MTMREHLRGVHAASADFHTKAAKAHASLSKCFSKMAESDSVEGAADLAAAHERLSKVHADAAEYCVGCAKSLDPAMKAAFGGDEEGREMYSRVEPTHISAVYKSDNVRPMPRNGQPQVGEPGSVETLDPTLAKVIGIGIEED